MAERLKFNKVSLREQKQKLALFRRFLPALEARKQQLLIQLELRRREIEEKQKRFRLLIEKAGLWPGLLGDMAPLMRPLIEIREVKSSVRNVAGLKLHCFEGIVFHEPSYSFFSTPFSFETVLAVLREAVEMREEIRLLQKQVEVLQEGFRKTNQRINLYEQRLIPGCREAIRKVTVHLQDQQAAAVGVAKVAKAMLEDAFQSSGG